MNKWVFILIVFLLSGCVDLGRVGIHPELKTTYFNGHKSAVENCLYSAALGQHLSMMADDPLPGGAQRYHIQDYNYQDVAWVDVSPFGHNQTSVNFYYAPNSPDVHKSIYSMISQCEHDFS